MKVIGIIPARYGSIRFPGKPLVDILGKSMIQRVYDQCKKSTQLNSVIVATDNNKIYNHVLSFGGRAMMTSKTHITGTERCNEVVNNLKEKFDVIVNVQGDEPLINPLQIDEIINLFNDSKTKIGTLVKRIHDEAIIRDKNTTKAIFDEEKKAVNFCREISNILPKHKYYKHVGIYAYKKDVLAKICKLPQSQNEIKEQLEQLRWLDNSYSINVGITNFKTLSVDNPEDIEKIKEQMI